MTNKVDMFVHNLDYNKLLELLCSKYWVVHAKVTINHYKRGGCALPIEL